MHDTTNQEAIDDLVEMLMDVEIQKTEFSPIIVSHPFFDCGIQNNTRHQLVNILEDEKALHDVKEFNLMMLHGQEPIRILFRICKPYRMFFVKMAFDALSDKDKGELLRTAWISQENPNDDINVSHEDILYMFKNCKSEYLMENRDYEFFKQLPDKVHIYRGVNPKGIENGFSWTLSQNIAHKFANRFGKEGIILEKDISKSEILAYFNNRDEREVIVADK